MKMLAHKANHRVAVALLFEPRDLWIGFYWKTYWEMGYQSVEVYVTIIPMLPIRISVLLGGS